LIFFNSLHSYITNVMLLICFARAEVGILIDNKWLCNIKLFFFISYRFWLF